MMELVVPHDPQSLSAVDQTAASTASMPNARPWRRRQAPKPRSGAPKAQGLMATSTVVARSVVPAVAPDYASTSIPPVLRHR